MPDPRKNIEHRLPLRSLLQLLGIGLLVLAFSDACKNMEVAPPRDNPAEKFVDPNAPVEIACKVDDAGLSQERFDALSAEIQKSNVVPGKISVGGYVVSGEMNGEAVVEEFMVVARSMKEGDSVLVRVAKDADGKDIFTEMDNGDVTRADGTVVVAFGVKSADGLKFDPILRVNPIDGTAIMFQNSQECVFIIGDDEISGSKNAMPIMDEYLPMLEGSRAFINALTLKKGGEVVTWGLREVTDTDKNVVVQIYDSAIGLPLAYWDRTEWKAEAGLTGEGAVLTKQGMVYVEDGKYMLLPTDGSVAREIKDISTEVTFKNTDDLMKVAEKLHAAELLDQEQLYNDLTPGNTLNDFTYNMEINKVAFAGGVESSILDFPGLVTEFATVESPTESSEFPEVGVVLLKQYGNPGLVPVVLGVFDRDGRFNPFADKLQIRPAESYPRTSKNDELKPIVNWNGFQNKIGFNIVKTHPLFAYDFHPSSDPVADADNRSKFTEVEGDYAPADRSAGVLEERRNLILHNLQLAGVAYDYLNGDSEAGQTGKEYADVETMYKSAGYQDLYYVSTYDFITVVTTP